MQEQVQQYIDEYTKELKELQLRLREKFNTSFHPQMLSLMDGFFESVTWTQYAPYFNDGDVCEFGLHIYDAFVPLGSEDDAVSRYDLENEELAERAHLIESFLQRVDDLLEQVYGNNKQIIVTREGVQVDDYDNHD